MAPSSRRKKLSCHYCNQRSQITYDGLITNWKCNKCEAVNYLDENGDITDPPASADSPAPAPIRYAIASSESVPSPSKASIFCAQCLKNQHLYTSSLAQYHIEFEIDNAEYESKNGAYYRFRRELEKRYPQVCVKCEPAVLQRMREAGKTAKADHLRRLMEKTRESRSNMRGGSMLTLDNAGKLLFNLGLYGQIIWNIVYLITTLLNKHPVEVTVVSNNESLTRITQMVTTVTTSRTWAYRTLLCTIASVWWSPKYKEATRGFTKHISGFKKWYQLQFIVVLLRSLFYRMTCSHYFSDPFTPIAVGVHFVMLLLTVLLAIKASSSLKINTAPLWRNIPDKLTTHSLSSPNPGESSGSLGDILDGIALDSNPRSSSTHISTSQAFPSLYSDRQIASVPEKKTSLQASKFKFSTMPVRSTPALSNMSEKEVSLYLQTGQVPSNLEQQHEQPTYEEMDWESTQLSHEFKPRPKPRPNLQNKLQDQMPDLDKKPTFWYKLPPAPSTPAQRLLKQSSLAQQAPLEKQKKDFFNTPFKSFDNAWQSESSTKHEIEISQQKFFPPEPPSEAGNILADLLTDFSLTGSEEKGQASTSGGTRYMIQSLTLAIVAGSIAVALYNYH